MTENRYNWKMKRSLIAATIVNVTSTILIAVYILPFLQQSYDLSAVQIVLLALVFISISGIITAGSFEFIFNLTLEKFLENLNQTWDKHKTLDSIDPTSLPPELKEILKTLSLVLESGAKKIKALESQGGYSQSYYRLITTISHQLRTPITGLRWALSIIQDEINKSRMPDVALVSSAREAANRIGVIVEGLLVGINGSEPQSKKARAPVDLERCLDDVISESSLSALERNMTFALVKENSPIPLISGTEHEIRFVLHSLISNAIYYGKNGTAVGINLGLEGSFARITVHNNGHSIPDDERALLFSQFNRGDDAIRLNPEGSGLGLYLTNQIVVDHGGAISFESDEKTGTAFTVTFPLSDQGQLEQFIRHQ